MADKMKMILNLFEGGAGGAGAAPAGDGAGEGGGETAAVTQGVLQDGTQMDNRLAARLEEQARKRRARGEEPVISAAAAAPQEQQAEPAPAEEQSLDDQWTEAKKGKFKDQYARDVQNAIKDRFKNQKDAEDALKRMEPMLAVLRERAGVETDDELIQHVMDDDSLYEEAADEAGMTVSAYRTFKAMEEQNRELREREEASIQDQMFRQHFSKLVEQGEDLKKMFPNFDLMTEMQDERFRRLTAPDSGLDVKSAYFAIHHDELEPQAMAYGIQRAQQQISQTIQANRSRPVEGAMRNGTPADIHVDPRTMKREERQKLIERARRGETIVF